MKNKSTDIFERVVSAAERRKRSILAKKIHSKLEKAKERLKTKYAPKEVLKRRSYKLAKNILRRKLAGKRGLMYQQLSPSDKIAVDKIVDKQVKLIKKIADRLMPLIRKKESQRLVAVKAHDAAVSGNSLGNVQMEGKTAKSSTFRLASLRSGLSRQNRIGKQFAAFKEPKEKSPAYKPRIQKTAASKTNAFAIENKNLNESYDLQISKAAGYGTFMTARDLGISIKAGFAYHPSVEEQLEELEKGEHK